MTEVKTGTLGLRKPIVCIFRTCCARVASGQTVAEPTIPLMKSRRRIAAPKAQSLCGLRFGMTQLQQGFAAGGMGFRIKSHGGNFEPLMSALGQKRTLKRLRVISALPPKADIGTQSRNVRIVPKAGKGVPNRYYM
jgi:hypothetical protein